MVLAVDDVARSLTDRPAWITGLDHRIDTQNLGQRDLTTATSARLAGERAGAGSDRLDVAEIHAPYSYQELLLAQALGIDAAGDGSTRAAGRCAATHRWPPGSPASSKPPSG